MPIAVVDTGPLRAAVDADDADHERSVRALERPGLQLVLPALIVCEAAYLIERDLGPFVEAAFLRGLAELDVEAPSVEDWPRMAELVEECSDFPLGAADASVVALAERLEAIVLITLDRRHFGAVRPRHAWAFELLPE